MAKRACGRYDLAKGNHWSASLSEVPTVECSLEVYQARYGSDERYSARLARRLVRADEKGDREVWVLVYGAMEPYTALFAGEDLRLRRRRFRSRRAAEAWAQKLLGIAPETWEEDDADQEVVH